MTKWRILAALTSTAMLVLTLFATSAVTFAHSDDRASTINQLHTISVVGSTANILDAHGSPITVDANPYGIAIAPPGTVSTGQPGVLASGDIVVSNFGANDTGTTLVRFPMGKGTGQLFNTPNAGTNGPAAEAFNAHGNDWVANYSGNNVQIFTPSGVAVVTITSPLFDKPWGQAFNGGTPNPNDGSIAAFFSTNAGNGTIDRIDIIPVNGKPTFKVFQIGQFPYGSLSNVPIIAPQGMAWVPTWTWDDKTYQDVLFVVDPARNRIAAFPNSSTINTTSMLSTDQGITVFRGGPLRIPAGLAINPINGDLLVVNQANNKLVEINPNEGEVVGTRVLDPNPVNPITGANSALFGIAATTDSYGNLLVYFTDDNSNTLNLLSK